MDHRKRENNSPIPITAFEDFNQRASDLGWEMKVIKNEISFNKLSKDVTFRILQNKIEVSIPLQEGDKNYVTSFNNYFEAQEYGMMHILNTEEWINN
tara:strand:+ start:1701 stop:1991 length:291 start_codon:yes stop_codon:yes gene_type:complete